MNVDRNLKNNKTGLLAYFRSRANEIVSELLFSTQQQIIGKRLLL